MSFPSVKTGKLTADGKAEYKEICNPITKDFRKELTDAIEKSFQTQKPVEFDDGKEERLVISAYPTGYDSKKVGEAKLFINDNFVISGISLFEMQNKTIYPAMPSYKTSRTKENGKSVYEEFCSVRTGLSKILKEAIVNEFKEVRKEREANRFSIQGKIREKLSEPEETKKKEESKELSGGKNNDYQRDEEQRDPHLGF